jgi:3-dehydroquinate synthase
MLPSTVCRHAREQRAVCYIEIVRRMTQTPIVIQSSLGPYPVRCASGILRRASREIAALGNWSSIHVVSSPTVWRALGKRLRPGLKLANSALVYLVPDGETSKNLHSVESVARALVRAGADRNSLIVAVGGGVVGDVAGFVAATYLRGVALVQVPTTLVAQVDSAMGGKTGVNLPEGKNLIGAFYPPKLILADPEVLRTLPDREYRGGLGEVIKYGVIADAHLFSFLEKNMGAALRRDAAAMDYIIRRSIQIKARVVSRDEKESGLREILNFGHTFGHALESVTKYRRYRHGEAIAWGMMCAALLGHEVNVTSADDVSRVVALVRRMGDLPAWPRVSPESMLDAMRSDKKTRGGKIRFVLTPRLGQAQSYDTVPLDAVTRVLHFAPQFLLRHPSSLVKLRD